MEEVGRREGLLKRFREIEAGITPDLVFSDCVVTLQEMMVDIISSPDSEPSERIQVSEAVGHVLSGVRKIELGLNQLEVFFCEEEKDE